VYGTRPACRKSAIEAGQEALKKRFLMIVVFFPLCFCTMLATISVYEKIYKHIFRDYMEYIHCLNTRKSADEDCPATHQRYRPITVAIIDLLLFDVFSIVLTAYILVPPAARSFWARVLSRTFAVLSRCKWQRCKKVEMETIEMTAIKTEECDSTNDDDQD
jgi:hypothetical protein